MTIKCGNCIFFKSDDGGSGLCRRKQPSVVGVQTLWPEVENEEWCGKFVDRETRQTFDQIICGVAYEFGSA